jgi:hypothetical protein
MMMKTLAALLAIQLASVSLAAAEGAKFAPLFTDPEFRFEPTVAAVIGGLKPEDAPSGLFVGAELNFNCGLFQTADQRMRTHLLLGGYDHDGVELSTIELSPRYTLPIGSGFSLGAGPGLAYVRSTVGNQDASHLAWMLAGGVNFRKRAYYAGVDLRYQDTAEKQLGGVSIDPNNWAIAAKVGYNF